MQISELLLILLIASPIIAGFIFFRLARHHLYTRIAIVITVIIDIAISSTLTFSTRQFSDYHLYNMAQWWILSNFIIATISISIGLAASISRNWFTNTWKKHRKGIVLSAIMIGFMPTLYLVYAAILEPYNVNIRHLDVEYDNLPKNFDGYRIAFFSDTHLGSFDGDTTSIVQAFDSIQANTPDMIIFAGDLVNNFRNETFGWENTFKILDAPYKLAIRGNHDTCFYFDYESPEAKNDSINKIYNRFKELGFDLFINNYRNIIRDTDTLVVCGTDAFAHPDYMLKDSAYYRRHFCIWLIHSPEFIEWGVNLFPRNYNLVLAGHTHGGQIGIRTEDMAFSSASFKYKFDAGLFTYKGNKIYVTSGLGFNALPMRLGVPPEVVIITLRKKVNNQANI